MKIPATSFVQPSNIMAKTQSTVPIIIYSLHRPHLDVFELARMPITGCYTRDVSVDISAVEKIIHHYKTGKGACDEHYSHCRLEKTERNEIR